MYRNTKKILVFSFLIMSFIGFGFYNVDAQVEQKFSPIADSVSCIDAQYDLSFGSRDYALYGNVQKLQHFLFENGIMYHAPTGYFGPITQASLIKYQTLRNLYPTGFFDANTRKAVAKETCEQNEIVNNVGTTFYVPQANTNSPQNPYYPPQSQNPTNPTTNTSTSTNTNTQIPPSSNTQNPYYYVPQTQDPYYSPQTQIPPASDNQIYYRITEQMLGF